MIWAGVKLDDRTSLHALDKGFQTSVRYREEILEPYVRLFRGAVGPGLLLMRNNICPHMAQLVLNSWKLRTS
ncbi:hypothetical protein X975_04936, partial [Stegodyphus mimosarum]